MELTWLAAATSDYTCWNAVIALGCCDRCLEDAMSAGGLVLCLYLLGGLFGRGS